MRTVSLKKKAYTAGMAVAGVTPIQRKDRSITSHFSDGVTLTFKNGETLIDGLDEPNGVYLIKHGFVKACSTSHDGHANLLILHEAGEFIPLPWSLDGHYVTGLYYVAVGEVTVIKSSKDKLRNELGTNMWLTHEILNQTVNVIAIYTQRIQALEFRSARGRIIAEMIFLAERFGRQVKTGILIEAPITHQDIADSINMNRETASRALEKLITEGLIGQTEHLFTIREPAKLRAALK